MKSILVVEDDQKIAHAISTRLKHHGFAVHVASDAPSALMQARKQEPDVALLDISLPGGSGLDVARNLQEHVCRNHLPVIFITASKEESLKTEAGRLGASAFLEKPFSARDLVEAIDNALLQPRRKMTVSQAASR